MPTPNERALRAGAASRPGASWLSWPAGLLALACAACGSMLALRYPLSGASALLLFVSAAIAAWLRPHAWLVMLPALLPLVGFAPWTGWITFEEFDLLVLAVAAGGYARLAWRASTEAPGTARRPRRSSAAALIGLTVALFAASTLLAMARGFADAGGFSFGWFQGYREPMNSLRVAKPFFAALLLWPLWNAASREAPQWAADRLSLGMMLGLLGASLAALWERLAFTDLLNFSSDYRTTAFFWEMHVGGAALDGFLALAMPFAVREMLVAPSKGRWALAAAVTALATYACLTTFSRGVYLAVPAGLGLMWALRAAQLRRTGVRPSDADAVVARLLLIGAFVVAAAWMFPGSGYRGMLALVGSMMVLLPLCGALRQATHADLIAGTCIGALLALAAAGCAWLLPKGAYVVYALGVLFTLAMLGLQRRTDGQGSGTGRHAVALAWAGHLWVLTGLALVALHWGGAAALAQALPVVFVLFATVLVGAFSPRELWPRGLRWQGKTLGAVVLSGSLVAAFGGGAYMGDRFAAVESDLTSRLAHWRLSASMLQGIDDWTVGKGAGRYADSYAIAAPENLRPGDYRLRSDGRGQHLRLTGGGELTGDPDKPMAFGGDIVRLSQRLGFSADKPQVSLDVLASKAVTLNIGVCTKHLLYPGGCMARAVKTEARPGEWQNLKVDLRGKPLSKGPWYAPRPVVFVVGVDSSGGEVDVDNLAATGADGGNLLSNGDFRSGLQNWFFTSDRSHLPWHAKNMALHVLFDQGLLGLALLGALAGGALWRVCLGNARAHALAPSLAGAVIGFAVVGLFDSLLDVPRVAFVWYSFLLVMLSLPVTAPRNDTSRLPV